MLLVTSCYKDRSNLRRLVVYLARVPFLTHLWCLATVPFIIVGFVVHRGYIVAL